MKDLAKTAKKIYLKVPWIIHSGIYSIIFGVFWLRPILQTLSYALDPSFIYGVEKAAINHISFGNHFIATYGPLGYAAQNFLPQEVGRTMIWQILTCIAVGFGVYIFSRLYLKNGSSYKVGFFALLLLLALSLSNNEWIYLNVFILYLFIYIKVDRRYRQYLMVGLTILASLLSLVKFTVGFGSIAALLIAIAFGTSGETLKQKLKNLAVTVVVYTAALSLLGYWLGITNAFTYVTSGIGISNGFSNTMSLITPATAIATKFVLAVFVIFIAWVLIKSKHNFWRFSFLLPPLYIVWKYAVVRQDGHILVILYTIPPLVVMFIFTIKKILLSDALLFILILLCCLTGAAINGVRGAGYGYSVLKSIALTPLTNIQSYQFVKFWEINSEEHSWQVQTNINLGAATLPAAMRRTIGSSGVDIFPYDADIVLANSLTWSPRPSPFSFETYEPQFDKDNAQFFNTNGPKFIIWHGSGGSGVDEIDGRYVLWDEPMTLQSILNHYKYVASNSEFILLERLSNPQVASEHVLTNKIDIGSGWSAVPKSTGLVCADIYINNTLPQAIKGLILRERPFFIKLRYSNGSTLTYRFVRETATDGLLVSPVPTNWADLISFLQNKESSDSVKAIGIVGEPSAAVRYLSCGENY